MHKETLITEGSWAVLRDAHEMTRGGQRRIQKAMAKMSTPNKEIVRRNYDREQRGAPKGEFEALDINPADLEALEEGNDACVLALVTQWSFDYSIDAEGLDKLPLQDYKELQRLCAPAIAAASVDFTPTPEAVADQNSPFGSSSESSGSSEAVSSTEASPKSFATTG